MFKRSLGYNFKVILLSLMVFNCEDDTGVLDNILDPGSGEYTEVETLITEGPSEGSVITSSSTTFSYTGGPLVVGYSHRLYFESNISDWSDWATDTAVTYENLDEGEYTFQVKGKYSESDIQSVPTERSFIVDAVSGPSIRVFPQVTYVETSSSKFQIDIIAEDLGENSPPVSGIELEIAYDFQKLDVFNSAPIIKGELINNYPGMDLLIDELGEGSITITIGVTEGFNSIGLTGTGILFSIELKALSSGQSNFDIISAAYRDANNTAIDIQNIISGTVIVGQ